MAVLKKDLYFDSLVDFVEGEEYRGILWRLYNYPFTWDDGVGTDRNRALDGLKLRDIYAEKEEIDENCVKIGPFDDCSVLELMIGMAIRCETDIMSVNGAGDRTIEWFWRMLDNLELYSSKIEEDLHDEMYQGSAEDYIWNILNRFVSRSYNYDGSNGGLFQISKPREDLRLVDLWLQLNWWLTENYNYELV